jgi:ADP-dependent NAD(P)H-hydrate dehydratase / NAD(P)H-hydrate epimerase
VSSVHPERIRLARDFARRHGTILVLKGHRTLIADPGGTVWVNPTGNPGMATGGMGDILTGIVAGLLAQELAGSTAADSSGRTGAVAAAVYLHGLAGDLACIRKGEHSLIATDLLEALPEAFRRARWGTREKTLHLHG